MVTTRLFAAAFAAVLLTTSACSAGDTPDTSPDVSAPPVSTGPLDGAGDADREGDIDEDDPYCAIMREALEESFTAASTLESLLEEITNPDTMVGGDMSALNAGGLTLLEHSERSLELYAEAQPHVDDSDASLAIDVLREFVTIYSVPVGEIMSTSGSFEDLADRLTDLTQNAAVLEVLEQAPAQQMVLQAYTEERCSIDLD
jgi:hypothetical protein